MLLHVIVDETVQGRDYIESAMTQAYGKGSVDLKVVPISEELRGIVRIHDKSPTTVLMVLSEEASKSCKGIISNQEKTYTYRGIPDLVSFLEEKYKISLGYIAEETPDVSSEEVTTLKEQLKDREMVIQNYQSQLSELRGILENDSKILTTPSDDNSKEVISDLESRVSSLQEENNSLLSKISELEESISEYKSSISSLKEGKSSIESNLGVKLSVKDEEISILKNQILELSSKDSEITSLQAELSALNKGFASLQSENATLKSDCNARQQDIENLRSSLADSVPKSDYISISEENSVLSSKLESMGCSLEEISSKYDSSLEELNRLREVEKEASGMSKELDVLTKKVNNLDSTLARVNQEKLEADSKIAILEKSVDRDTELEDILKSHNKLVSDYDTLVNSVYGVLSRYSDRGSKVPINLVRGITGKLPIKLVFSGNSESRKETYRQLLTETSNSPDKKFIILDLTTEFYIDYIFSQLEDNSCIDWLNNGGSINKYLCKTKQSNVSILSLGITYTNDLYFLGVDWSSRLKELSEMDDYSIIMVCGDISSVVGRVMHESLAGVCDSYIYTKGTYISLRNLILNLRGISNYKESKICYLKYSNIAKNKPLTLKGSVILSYQGGKHHDEESNGSC